MIFSSCRSPRYFVFTVTRFHRDAMQIVRLRNLHSVMTSGYYVAVRSFYSYAVQQQRILGIRPLSDTYFPRRRRYIILRVRKRSIFDFSPLRDRRKKKRKRNKSVYEIIVGLCVRVSLLPLSPILTIYRARFRSYYFSYMRLFKSPRVSIQRPPPPSHIHSRKHTADRV